MYRICWVPIATYRICRVPHYQVTVSVGWWENMYRFNVVLTHMHWIYGVQVS